MGWYGGYASIKAIHEEILKPFSNNTDYVLIDHKATTFGLHLWIAMKIVKTGESFVALTLIRKDGEFDFAYKDMDESCGPCYYDCPLSLLNRTTGVLNNSISKEWREKVRAFHNKIKNGFEIGQIIKLWDEYYTITEKRGRCYRMVDKNGKTWRLPPRQFREVEKPENCVEFIKGG